jgi:hypothetical protein
MPKNSPDFPLFQTISQIQNSPDLLQVSVVDFITYANAFLQTPVDVLENNVKIFELDSSASESKTPAEIPVQETSLIYDNERRSIIIIALNYVNILAKRSEQTRDQITISERNINAKVLIQEPLSALDIIFDLPNLSPNSNIYLKQIRGVISNLARAGIDLSKLKNTEQTAINRLNYVLKFVSEIPLDQCESRMIEIENMLGTCSILARTVFGYQTQGTQGSSFSRNL